MKNIGFLGLFELCCHINQVDMTQEYRSAAIPFDLEIIKDLLLILALLSPLLELLP